VERVLWNKEGKKGMRKGCGGAGVADSDGRRGRIKKDKVWLWGRGRSGKRICANLGNYKNAESCNTIETSFEQLNLCSFSRAVWSSL
jgi:hypothetical protein